jgi:hypothetical protein
MFGSKDKSLSELFLKKDGSIEGPVLELYFSGKSFYNFVRFLLTLPVRYSQVVLIYIFVVTPT